MGLLIAAALFLAVAAPAAAQRTVDDLRINQLIIYGADPCPASTEEEIIVCARKPESDRYRIPENLRRNPNEPANRSWTERAIELSYVGRTGTQSCSTVGPGLDRLLRSARRRLAG